VLLAVFFAFGPRYYLCFRIIIYHGWSYSAFFFRREKRPQLTLEVARDLIHVQPDIGQLVPRRRFLGQKRVEITAQTPYTLSLSYLGLHTDECIFTIVHVIKNYNI